MKHIRIISPSGVIDPSYIDGAAARLRSWGYAVSEGTHARDTWGRFAGRDDDRLADLMEALADPSVDVILCSRGGYGLQRIIDRVPKLTKPIIGFSDITALHQLSAISGQPSLHGIMCKHIATLPEESEPIVALRNLLAGKAVEYTWDAHPLNRPGDATAPIIGGNLSVLYGLQCERHYHIDRMMRNLKMSGVLANISGLIVGQFTDCEDDPLMNETVYDTIKEAVAEYDYPVLFNAPIGHVEHNVPLWLNHEATIHCGTNSILSLRGLDI